MDKYNALNFKEKLDWKKLSANTCAVSIYDELNNEIKDAINNVKKENYVNYFNYAYKKENLKPYTMKISTLFRKPKIYKTT